MGDACANGGRGHIFNGDNLRGWEGGDVDHLHERGGGQV